MISVHVMWNYSIFVAALLSIKSNILLTSLRCCGPMGSSIKEQPIPLGDL